MTQSEHVVPPNSSDPAGEAPDYRQKLDEVATLVARVRHEINNPLTGVLGQAQLLLREDLNEKARKRAESIEELALRLKDIVMVGMHVAHNCRIGDDNIFANEVALAGHIEIEDHVFVSNNVGAHQFVRMGRYAMVGGKSKIVQDVLPFYITDGNPPRVRGLNSVGLRRAGFSTESRSALKRAYQVLFRNALALEEALTELARIDDPHVTHLVQFIEGSKRGFHRAHRQGDEAE